MQMLSLTWAIEEKQKAGHPDYRKSSHIENFLVDMVVDIMENNIINLILESQFHYLGNLITMR